MNKMANVIIKLKIMPESLDIDLEELKGKIEKALEKAGSVKINLIEVEEIAFGLKALIITLAWPENLDTEKAENAAKIPGVSSVEVIDYRRAFG